MPTPLNRVIIFVGDVQKCARFYIDTFGFTVIPSDDSPTDWIELDTGGCRLAFHRVHGPHGPEPTGSDTNPHKIVFYTPDVPATRAAILARGSTKMGKIHTYGSLTFCDGQDPEGHVFQLSNRP